MPDSNETTLTLDLTKLSPAFDEQLAREWLHTALFSAKQRNQPRITLSVVRESAHEPTPPSNSNRGDESAGSRPRG
jgi:hypothetical protein